MLGRKRHFTVAEAVARVTADSASDEEENDDLDFSVTPENSDVDFEEVAGGQVGDNDVPQALQDHHVQSDTNDAASDVQPSDSGSDLDR